MAKAKVNLHDKRKRLMKAEDPNEKKIAKVTARIAAGDDKPNENLFQRRRRLKLKKEGADTPELKAHLKERLQGIKGRIQNPAPDDMKARRKKQGPADKPMMKRPKTQREGFGRY